MIQNYIGVVESRADPKKNGRCKVRVVGVHTEDTNILPTKDLPWAYPLGSITSASMNGIGQSPTGVVEGTLVLVTFLDGDSFQQPMMIGTIGGIPEKDEGFGDTGTSTSGSQYEGTSDIADIKSQEKQDGALRDSNGKLVTDENGNPVSSGKQVLSQEKEAQLPTKTKTKDHTLGSVSEKYETGNKGPGTINDYRGKASGDYGGASYGKWQLASYRDANGKKAGSPSRSPVMDFVGQSSHKDEFNGLTPGTAQFDSKWRDVAAKDPKGFEEEQRNYIAGQYYTPALNKLRSNGTDLSNKGPGVQDMVWSTSVQYGPTKGAQVIERALKGQNVAALSDAKIIELVQDSKKDNVENDFKKSPSLHDSLKARTQNEKKDLLALAGDDSEMSKGEVEAAKKRKGIDGDSNLNIIPASGIIPPETPASNNGKPGFKDPFGKYPKQKWLNEPDTSRLARNEKTDETIVAAKVRSLIQSVGIAGGGSWDEPKSPYNAQYPLNQVYQTESGHVVEYDDTPGAERIHIYHRSGSFVELHPNGDVVFKSVKDNYHVTVQDSKIYVGGDCNITVKGNSNVYTHGVMNMESDGDMNIKTGSNLRIGAEGDIHIESNRECHIGASGNLHASGTNIYLNCSWSPSSTSAGDYELGKITVSIFDDGDVVVPPSAEESTKNEVASNDPSIDRHAKPAEKKDMNITKMKKDPMVSDFDKDSINPKTKLSSNVTVADVTTSTALTKDSLQDQAGMEKDEIAENLHQLSVNVIEPLRASYGNQFVLTSVFRKYTGANASGNVSQHCKGQAADIQFPGLKKGEAIHRAEEISRMLPNGYDQMILEYHGNNPVIHISYNKDRNRMQKKSTYDLSKYFSGFLDQNMNKVYD